MGNPHFHLLNNLVMRSVLTAVMRLTVMLLLIAMSGGFTQSLANRRRYSGTR